MSEDSFRIDSHKLLFHPRRVAHWLEAGEAWSLARQVYPIYIELSPIGACNHRCLFCALDYLDYRPQRLDPAMLAERLPAMAGLGIRAIMLAGEGEPLLHREINVILRLIAEAGIDCAVTTNATVFPEGFVEESIPRLSWLKASINAGTSAGYARIHQAPERDFQAAQDHLRQAVDYRNRHHLACTLGAQALLLPENAHELDRLARLCRDEIGLDYLVIKPYSQHLFSRTTRYQGVDYAPLLQLGDALRALSTDRFQVIFRSHTMAKHLQSERYPRCYATPFFWAYVMANGEVYGCSAYLGDARFAYGNLNQEDFQTIWEGERRRESCDFVAHRLDIQECRKNCRMDEVNRYLHQLRSQPVPHVNFI